MFVGDLVQLRLLLIPNCWCRCQDICDYLEFLQILHSLIYTVETNKNMLLQRFQAIAFYPLFSPTLPEMLDLLGKLFFKNLEINIFLGKTRGDWLLLQRFSAIGKIQVIKLTTVTGTISHRCLSAKFISPEDFVEKKF